MARRKSRTSATGGNMDSMLDTLTNVVGILVIVLVAVQLSSQEAASRIADAVEKIDPEQIKRLEEEAKAAQKARDEALAALKKEQQSRSEDPEKALERLRQQAAAAEKKVQEDAKKAAELERQAKEALAAEEKMKAELKKLEELAKKEVIKREALAVELEKLEGVTPPPVDEVRLPNPRPLPATADGKPLKLEEINVICHDGLVIPIVDRLIREPVEEKLAKLVKARKLDPSGDNWLNTEKKDIAIGLVKKRGTKLEDEFSKEQIEMADKQTDEEIAKLIEDFNKSPPVDPDFVLSIERVGNQIVIVPKPKKDKAEKPADAIKGEFARAMRQTNPSTVYFFFRVEPDSFGAYLQIRQFTDAAGFFSGWEPVDPPYVRKVSTKYRVGTPPPPPPPSPPTDPSAPKPPAPKPPNILD
jgi:flagellar motor protein MotB